MQCFGNFNPFELVEVRGSNKLLQELVFLYKRMNTSGSQPRLEALVTFTFIVVKYIISSPSHSLI